jgi:hypothetical protein
METKILIKRINGKEMFFEKINKIGKLLAKLAIRKRKTKQININLLILILIIRNEKGYIT